MKESYEKKYNDFQINVKTISSIIVGISSIILLGEVTFTFEYLSKFIVVLAGTIILLFSSLLNTPENFNSASNYLKKNKLLKFISYFAIFVGSISSFYIFYIKNNTDSIPVTSVITLYFVLLLVFFYSLIAINKFFSK